jgi:outer membrane protein
MKVLCFAFFLLLTLSVQGQEQAENLTLEACINYAMQNSESIKNAQLDREIARTDVNVTKAQGLPQVNGSVNYQNGVRPFIVPPGSFGAPDGGSAGGTGGGANGGAADADPQALALGFDNSFDATVQATQLLFDGSYFIGLRAAKVYTELTTKDYELTRANVTEAVTKAYYGALISEERLSLLKKSKSRLDTLLYETRMLYENGFAESIDVDRLQVQANNTQVRLNQTERALETSYLLLKFQMGMSLDKEINLAGDLSEISLTPNLKENIDFQYSDRMEYSKLNTNQRLAELDIKNNVWQHLPRLNASFTYGYTSGSFDFETVTNFGADYTLLGLSLTVPVFDGFLKHNRIQRNKIQLQQLENAKTQLSRNIDIEIVQARSSLETSIEDLEVQKKNVELANRVLETARIKYAEGVGANLEVVTAQTEYEEAETNYYSSLYDALIARVELDKALGRLAPEPETE